MRSLTLLLLLLTVLPFDAMSAPASRGCLAPRRIVSQPPQELRITQRALESVGVTHARRDSLIQATSDSSFVAIMVEFAEDSDPLTTGNGQFSQEPDWPDSVAHDSAYFRRQLDHLEAYWQTVSRGRFPLKVDLDPRIHRLSDPMARYGADDASTQRAVELLRDAVALADAGVDFSRYLGVIIIHAGAGQEADAAFDTPSDIWSAYLSAEDVAGLEELPDGIPTNDGVFLHDGVIVPETENQDSGPGQYEMIFAGFGVLAHETGHFLGLPDLYDTGPAPSDSWGIGAWGIMGLGAWNANGFSPPHPCAWAKLDLNWVEGVQAEANSMVELLPMESERPGGAPGEVLRIDISPTESFVVSFRQGDENGNGCFDFVDPEQDGLIDFFSPLSGDSYLGAEFDYFLPTGSGQPCGGSSAGVLVWHVDWKVIAEKRDLDLNRVNDDRDRKGVDLEEASGVQGMDQFPGSWGGADDFWLTGDVFGPDDFPSSGTNDGGRTGLELHVDSVEPSRATIHYSLELVQLGFPVQLAEPAGADLLLVDFDRDGAEDVTTQMRSGSVSILRGKGHLPMVIPLSGGAAGVAADDLDGDGHADLVIQEADGRVHAYRVASPTGWLEPAQSIGGAWGAQVGDGFVAGPVIADVYSDSGAEVLVVPTGLAEGLRLLGNDGEAIADARWGGPAAREPAIALDGTIGVIGRDGGFRAFRMVSDSLDPVFSFQLSGAAGAAPVVLPVEGGEAFALVERGGVAHLVAPGLPPSPNWPIRVAGEIAAPLALAELSARGRVDILAVSSWPSILHRWDEDGDGVRDWEPEPLSGASDTSCSLAPLVADLAGAGNLAVTVIGADGAVQGFTPATGGRPPAFPLQAPGPVDVSGAVGDLDGDGDLELVVADRGGQLMAWDFDGKVTAWAQAGGGPERRGRYTGDGTRPDPSLPEGLLDPALTFAYPNPAVEWTRIHYRLGEDAVSVAVAVMDVRGNILLEELITSASSVSAGDHHWSWDLAGVARGVYFVTVRVRGAGKTGTTLVKVAVQGQRS